MKSRIPKFKSLEEEREFWQTHSVTDFLDELTPVHVEFTKPATRKLSIHLSPSEAHVLHQILARLSRAVAHAAPAHSKG